MTRGSNEPNRESKPNDDPYARILGPDPLRDVDDEIVFHLASRQSDLVARGLTAEEARIEALRGFGNVQSVEKELKAIGKRRKQRQRRSNILAEVGFDA